MATSMTRQHFQAIAEAVWDYTRIYGDETFDAETLAGMLAQTLGRFNANFDRRRFIDACTNKGK